MAKETFLINPILLPLPDKIRPPMLPGDPDPIEKLPVANIDQKMNAFFANIPDKNTEAFVEPFSLQLDAFYHLMRNLLTTGKFPSQATLDSVEYEMFNLSYPGQKVVGLFHKKNNGGTYLVNLAKHSNPIALMVPHPVLESGTFEQGLAYFKQGHKLLTVAGTHRCANSEKSDCDGTDNTVVCDGEHKVSDVVHYPHNYYNAALRAFRDSHDQSIAIDFHGFDSLGDREAIVSNGRTTDQGEEILSNRMDEALEALFPPDASYVHGCNNALDPNAEDKLCGITNVVGRMFNGSPEVCKTAAPNASQRFLHLEQSPWLRSDENRVLTLEALDHVLFP